MATLDPLEVSLEGHGLVEASAGTGKTYTLTMLFVRLLLERELSMKDILVVTYTRAAASELRDRVRAQIDATLSALEGREQDDRTIARYADLRRQRGTADADRERLRHALAEFDQASISTIHGFCERVLREHAFTTGTSFDAKVLQQTLPVLEEIAQDYVHMRLTGAPEIVVRHLQKRRIGPAALAYLFMVSRSAPTKVIPVNDIAGFESALDTWSTSKARVASQWDRDRSELVALLRDGDALNRAAYRRKSIEKKWIPFMDSLSSVDGTALPDWFEKLTPDKMRSNTKKGFSAPSHSFFDACEVFVESTSALELALRGQEVAFQREFLAYAKQELARRGEAGAFLTYEDLLERVHDALVGPSGPQVAGAIAHAYPAALIDEFQDTDPLQHAIFQRIYAQSGSVWMIGDPKQAIYAFRGADVFAYLRAASEPGLHQRTLDTNWRSDPRLIRAVNTVFGRGTPPFINTEIAFRPATPAPISTTDRFESPLEILWLDDGEDGTKPVPKKQAERAIPELVAREIVTLLKGDVSAAEVAILCRTNAQARDMQSALRTLAIPSALDGDANIFDSETAECIEWLLEAAANPSDGRALRRALSGALFGHDLDDLWRIRHDPSEWERWRAHFQEWSRLWYEHGFARFVHAFLEHSRIEQALIGRPEGERLWTDFDHLTELLQRAAEEEHLHPNQLLIWLQRMRAGGAARGELNTEETQQRIETDAPGVQITTIHKSKGLEYPIVYCPFLWGGAWLGDKEKRTPRFHDPAEAHQMTIDLGSSDLDAHRALARDEAFAEGIRLLYVALTRAKHRCTVVWGRLGDWEKAPLARFLHGTDPGSMPRSSEAMLADLESLAVASEGTITISQPIARPVEPFESQRSTAKLEVATAARGFDTLPRFASFSTLAGSDEGIARDATVAKNTDDLLGGFPAGRRSGSLLHGVLETVDFESITEEELAAVLDSRLRVYGFESHWTAPLAAGLRRFLQTPLLPDGPSLRMISRSQRLTELEFTLSMGQDGQLTGQGLAEALSTVPRLPSAYLRSLGELQRQPLRGFLRGFVDLVFQWKGRWYIVDYKSNKLPAYDDESIAEAMAEHHYFLQYHLYVVALHRYLGTRSTDYDYGEDFGGVFYPFLRGMDGTAATSVFYDRPSTETVRALDALLGKAVRDAR